MKKKNAVEKSTFKVALCGIIAALCTALMMMTGIIPVGTYALPCFAGVLISAIVIEYGCKWSLSVYAVVSILSLLLAGDKEAVLYFIMIFGYYPALKAVIEGKIKNRIAVFVLKLAIFNAAAVISFFIGTFLLAIPAEEYELFGVYIPWIFLILGNVIFLLYDRLVTIFVIVYVRRLRDKVFK